MAISRRQFVVGGAVAGAGALVIGVRLSESLAWAQESDAGKKKPAPNPFDAYVHVKPDGQISLIVAESEMGQGIKTGFALILAGVDVPSKVNGSAQFGIDVRVPEMVFAVVARCPTFGGKVAHFDAGKAKAIAGVRDAFEIPALGRDMFTAGGIVVVADSTWTAMKGREALQITWNHGAAVS